MTAITCLACSHVDEAPDGTELADDVFRCDECGARMAFGTLMPRLVVEPFVKEPGHRFVRLRLQDYLTKTDAYVVEIDADLAVVLANELLAPGVGT